MPNRLEIMLKPELFDPEGETIRKKAKDYFGIELFDVRTISITTIDAKLSRKELQIIRKEIFTNPVTQVSSYDPLSVEFDWCIRVGYRPGVRDNPGSTAKEAIENLLNIEFNKDEAVYTAKRYCIKGDDLTYGRIEKIAGELIANDIIQEWNIYRKNEWDPDKGVGYVIPKVILNHTPTVSSISIESDSVLKKISDQRNLALNPNDIPVIRDYFLNSEVQAARTLAGLFDPTDIELEYISQARSDHCNHNTFRGRFNYSEPDDGKKEIIDNLFKTCIEAPTLELKSKKDWVVSVLWDNAGIGKFDSNNNYVITGETHNSPSNMEAYGGAITGIVGIYRDPMGTGKGSKLVMGSYGFCVGQRDYSGDLNPRLHPRRLLDGVIEGVRDGGNKSGIPTTFGQVHFHNGYMGKCLVFVTAVGIMPAKIEGAPTHKKKTSPGDIVIMCGGRVGKDGIHGVTAASETFSRHTPAGHVQIGDPYTQKKMHDFLLEARDNGLIKFITDNGGGGLSSSIGESALFAGGCEIDLEKVPLKYEGLDQWEIWISESQERMTVAVTPDDLDQFLVLSKKHAVESTVIGKYTDSGKLHIKYNGKTCAFVDLSLLESGFRKWEFDAVWTPSEKRGLYEPVLSEPEDYEALLKDILARPNICSKEWITRQYDHEVQGTSVIKPLVGENRDVNSDAAVIRPVLDSDLSLNLNESSDSGSDSQKGLAFSQALIPNYGEIDAGIMTCCVIDEAVRRLVAVGANLDHIGGVDNFCWPDIAYHPKKNPDGKFKAAQLVRACQALKSMCLAYGIPLLSGKDSMYVDGHLPGRYGETHKISALPTLQFSAISVVEDIEKCVTMDLKAEGDLVYVLGETRDESGGSEYYEHFGYIGINAPIVYPDRFIPLYKALSKAIEKELTASVHGVYRGGLGVHLAMIAMGGNLGMEIDMGLLPTKGAMRNDKLLFSESAGRFIATISPQKQDEFEKTLEGCPKKCVGKATGTDLIVKGTDGTELITTPVADLKRAWKKPFENL